MNKNKESDKGKSFEVEVLDGVIPGDWEPYLEIVPGKYRFLIEDVELVSHKQRFKGVPYLLADVRREVVSADLSFKIKQPVPSEFYTSNYNLIQFNLYRTDNGTDPGMLFSGDSTLTKKLCDAIEASTTCFPIHFSGIVEGRAKKARYMKGEWSATGINKHDVSLRSLKRQGERLEKIIEEYNIPTENASK